MAFNPIYPGQLIDELDTMGEVRNIDTSEMTPQKAAKVYCPDGDGRRKWGNNRFERGNNIAYYGYVTFQTTQGKLNGFKCYEKINWNLQKYRAIKNTDIKLFIVVSQCRQKRRQGVQYNVQLNYANPDQHICTCLDFVTSLNRRRCKHIIACLNFISWFVDKIYG